MGTLKYHNVMGERAPRHYSHDPRDTIENSLPRQVVPIVLVFDVVMILPQVHLRKPCYDFTFL